MVVYVFGNLHWPRLLVTIIPVLLSGLWNWMKPIACVRSVTLPRRVPSMPRLPSSSLEALDARNEQLLTPHMCRLLANTTLNACLGLFPKLQANSVRPSLTSIIET